jgi:hypothetical protein
MSQSRRIIAYAFAAAMVIAPFLALIYGLTAGLAVLTLALGTTTYVTFDASCDAPPDLRQRLRLLAAINAVLGLIALGLLVARLLGWL